MVQLKGKAGKSTIFCFVFLDEDYLKLLFNLLLGSHLIPEWWTLSLHFVKLMMDKENKYRKKMWQWKLESGMLFYSCDSNNIEVEK